MIIHTVQQGSREWMELRAGIPTASRFDDILTPSGKPSASAERYMFTLLAERLMGHPVAEHVSLWMERGSQMEADAVAFYHFQRDCETQPVGFVTNDEQTIGASPDRLVDDDGQVEIKCPNEATHVSYLVKKSVDHKYRPQVQGQLWITGRAWCDILSFHPELPPALIRVERDEAYIAVLSAAVTAFSQQLESLYLTLCESGMVPEHKRYEPSLVDVLKASMIEINKSRAPTRGLAGE